MFVVPEWTALAGGLRPPRELEHHEPGAQRAGWQHEAASCVERHCRATWILLHLSPTRRAMLRSQSGPVAGIPFSTTPSSCLTPLELALFRVLLQRRLSLPLLLTKRFCRCGRLLDAFGHHRSLLAVRSAGEKGLLVGKRSYWSVQRGRGAWLQTSSCETFTWESRMPTTTDVWRLWPTVCHSLVACSLDDYFFLQICVKDHD